jgi:hypothetical protein
MRQPSPHPTFGEYFANLASLFMQMSDEREDGGHWHILLYPTDSGQLVLRLKNGKNEPLEGFRLALDSRLSARQ